MLRLPVTIFGFPLRVSPFFFLLCAMLAMPRDVSERALIELGIWIAAATVSVLWHELGHAFAMRNFGYSPAIELTGIGGLTHWGRVSAMPTIAQRIVVSLAGPFAGFILGGFVYAAVLLLDGRGHWSLGVALRDLFWINVLWGAVNLVPMVPWDGGHVLHAVLDKITNGRGRKPVAIVTIVLGVGALALSALVLRQLWPAFLAIFSVAAGVRLLRAPDAPKPIGDVLGQVGGALARLGPELIARNVVLGRTEAAWAEAAKAIEDDVLGRETNIAHRAHALELEAWALLIAGRFAEAAAAADRMPATHDPSALLVALLAAKTGTNEEALAAARELTDDEEAGARFALESTALLALGRSDEAIALAVDRSRAAFLVERLFTLDRFDEAASLAARTFERYAHPQDAYNAACSHARAHRPLDGLLWLERAIEAGYDRLDELERDEDLATVRDLPEFARVRERFRS